MPRGGRSLGGGRRSGGIGGGFGAASRLSAAAESRRTTPVAHRPILGRFSSMGERSDCRSLYRSYMRLVREQTEGEDDFICIEQRQQLEDFCSQYKSVWSGWWTERDDKDLCKNWSEFYDRCAAEEGGPERYTSVKMFAERVCRGVRSSSSPSSSSSSLPSLMGYLTSKEVKA